MIADGNYITSHHLKCNEKYLLVDSYNLFCNMFIVFIPHILKAFQWIIGLHHTLNSNFMFPFI